MDNLAKPLAVMYGFRNGSESINFLGKDEEITIELPGHIHHLEEILKHCSGRKTWEQILESVTIETATFWQLAEVLSDNEIVINGVDYYRIFHSLSSNPMSFANSLNLDEIRELVNQRYEPEFFGPSIPLIPGKSVLRDLGQARHSTRSFSAENLDFSELSTFVTSLYGAGEARPTPSAGQVYPLEIFLIALRDSANLPKGVYWFDSVRQQLVTKSQVFTTDEIAFALNTNLVDNAPYVLCVAADLGRVTKKYSNRGYRFALIEAGHICQNAYLAAAEMNLAIVSYGGFCDRAMNSMISDEAGNYTPLITMIFGKQGQASDSVTDFLTLAIKLTDELVGDDKPIEGFSVQPISHRKFQIPKYCANAKYRSSDPAFKIPQLEKEMFGMGIASSESEAKVKALAEAYERYCSSVVRWDIKTKASNLAEEWLDPRVITPMNKVGKAVFGLSDFSEDEEIEWLAGRRYLSGSTVYGAIDHMYYPLRGSTVGRSLFYSSCSSGVAAHTDLNVAIKKAMYELVERDALAVLWYTKKPGLAIPRDLIPKAILDRAEYWENDGAMVRFVDISLDSSPVVMAIIAGRECYPCFAAGAGSNDDYSEAIRKSWDEAETLMWGWRHRRLRKPRNPESVLTPLDHGRLYFRPEHFDKVQWLLEFAEGSINHSSINPLEKFNPAIFDLSLPQYPTVKVVRVISEHLLPINFGYGTEHYGHKRFADLGLEWKESIPAFPHFMA